MHTARGDADIVDKEMQIINQELLREKESMINHQETVSRLRNINNLTDMGFSLNELSPYPQLEMQLHKHQLDLEQQAKEVRKRVLEMIKSTHPQPSSSNGGTSTSVFPPRNTGTGRPQVHCSDCAGNDHYRKDCQQNNFCTIKFMCTVVAKTTLQVIAPVSPMTIGKNLDQHQETPTVLDTFWGKYWKCRSSTKKHRESHAPETRKH